MSFETLLPALVVNLAFGLVAFAVGGVRGSGLVGGLVIGIPVYLFLNWPGFVVLSGMFVLGTLLTRLGYKQKERMGVAEEKRGARGASHALANGGVAALCAAGSWVAGGDVWAIAFTAALATSSMDTAGSEIGPLWGKRTVSLKDFSVVTPGTEGAISLEGTLGGLLVAFLLGSLAWATGLIPGPAILAVVAGALLGNLYEGILGSRQLLPHTWLNATNTLVGALVAALLTLMGLDKI